MKKYSSRLAMYPVSAKTSWSVLNGIFRLVKRTPILQTSVDNSYNYISAGLSRMRLDESGEARKPSYYIPISRNNRFVGRTDALNKLKATLTGDCERIARIALVGMGGIGKTEIALQIAFWAKDNLPGFSVYWASALSDEAFGSSCEEIIEKLALPRKRDDDPKPMLKRYLSSDKAGSWLLIVDNLDDIQVLKRLSKHLPQNDNGRTLFTTRSPEVGRIVAEDSQHALSEMSESDAGDLLTRLLPQRQHAEYQTEAQCLLKELDHIPLAIKHATAYIERNKITVAKYLDIMKSSETELVNLMSREFAHINDSGVRFTSIATTWLVSFEQIAKDDPRAARILEFVSQIEPKAIPRSILPDNEGQEQLSHAVGTLLGYAFITKREEQDVYDMHSLVHLAARIWIERKGHLQSCVADSLAHLSGIFSIKTYPSKRQWREFAPHLLRLIGVIEEDQFQEPQILWLGLAIAAFLAMDGRDREAADLYQHILERVERVYFPPEEDDDVYRLNLAVAMKCYLGTQRHRETIKLAKKVIEERKFALAAEKHVLLEMHFWLAKAYQMAGQEDESLAVADQACQEMPTIEAVEDAEFATVQCDIALVYAELGRLSMATDMLKRLVAVWDDSGKKNHEVVIKAQYHLARIFEAKNCKGDAIEILENLWKVARQADAEANHMFLSSRMYLARLLLYDSQPGRAIKVCEAILGIFERNKEPMSQSKWFETQRVMAIAYSRQGELLKASNLLERTLAADIRLYNDQDRALLESELDLGIMYCNQGRKDEGIQILRSVADLRKRILGENHERTLRAIDLITECQRL